jgi:hypothetical protein
LAACLSACLVDPTNLPDSFSQSHSTSSSSPALCVSGFHAGQTLTVRLGEVYDAQSDYEFPTDPPYYLQGIPRAASCNGQDGLGPGSDVTFYLDAQYDDLAPYAQCTPLARVPSPSSALASQISLAGQVNATIAFLVQESSSMGIAMLQLATPTDDPSGMLEAGATPPLVVTRSAGPRDGGAGAICGDAWVATWESSP